MNRLARVEFLPCPVEASTEDVTTVADEEEEFLFPRVYTDTLAELAVEAVV